MASSISAKWMEAAKTLAVDASAQILCPQCGEENLEVQDVQNNQVIERHLRCKKCGAYNALRINLDIRAALD